MDNDTEALIDSFADRSFRDIADKDYIAGRLSYMNGLDTQFLWQSLQAIEKYFKAIFCIIEFQLFNQKVRKIERQT